MVKVVLRTGTTREKLCAAAVVVVAGTCTRDNTTTAGSSRSKLTARRDTDTCSRSRKWSQAPGNIEDLGTTNHAFPPQQAAKNSI